MKTDIATVEVLADVVAKQARLIAALHGVILQLQATTSLDDEVETIQRLASELVAPAE